MTSTEAFTTRLSSLSESYKTTYALVQRLAKLNPQPGSAPLTGNENSAITELGSEIHERLKQETEELELVKQEFEELEAVDPTGPRRRESEKDREKARLKILIVRLTEDYEALREAFRKAQLQVRRNSEQVRQKERELLFSGIREGVGTPTSASPRRNKELTKDELLANASSDVTAALRRTHQLMSSELTRSRFAQETLEQSTNALSDLSQRYTSLDSLLANSKNLLGSLVRSQKSDTWYLETAFYILLTTIVWILFRRIFYGPLWLVVWLPFKYSAKIIFSVFGAVGLTGSSSAATTSVSTRPSLIVKPSAQGKPPRLNKPNHPRNNYFPAGGGGHGAKIGVHDPREDPSPQGSLSQQVGQMAESSNPAQTQKPIEGHEKVVEPARRGDGQPLVESDRPPNRKKRIWDEDAERAKLEEARQQEADEPAKRGDGETLAKPNEPANEKKRMWDEDAEQAKLKEAADTRERDEL